MEGYFSFPISCDHFCEIISTNTCQRIQISLDLYTYDVISPTNCIWTKRKCVTSPNKLLVSHDMKRGGNKMLLKVLAIKYNQDSLIKNNSRHIVKFMCISHNSYSVSAVPAYR